MSGPVLVPSGGGEVIDDAPWRRVEILADEKTLAATWSRFGPHRDGADLHVHRLHTDLFYVLDGQLELRLGVEDERITVPAGALVLVPPLVVHGFRNGTDADVSYLNLHAPGQRFAGYLRALRDGQPFSYDQHDPPVDGGRSVGDVTVSTGAVVVDRPGLIVSLLADVEEIALSETRAVPGARLSPPVVGRGQVAWLYVLAGALTFTIGSGELRAEAGAWMRLPPGAAYALAIAGDADARYLSLLTPGSARHSDALDDHHVARVDDESTTAVRLEPDTAAGR
jgi:quercetin dioxygenase-like cupin family protein